MIHWSHKLVNVKEISKNYVDNDTHTKWAAGSSLFRGAEVLKYDGGGRISTSRCRSSVHSWFCNAISHANLGSICCKHIGMTMTCSLELKNDHTRSKD